MKLDAEMQSEEILPAPLEGLTSSVSVNRRALLKGTGAVVLATFAIPATSKIPIAEAATFVPNAFAYIAMNGDLFTIYVGQSEMGQGIMTGMAQILAEELCIPFSQVRVEHAPTSDYLDLGTCQSYNKPATYSRRSTGGSTSMISWYGPLRQAGANIRERLRKAAADQWGTTSANVSLSPGIATYNNQTLSWASLAGAAANDTTTTGTPLNTMNIVGTPVPRVDIPDKVTGAAVFGIDVHPNNTPRLLELKNAGKNLLYAGVQHCPTLGGSLSTTPATPSGALAVVNLTNAVAVVADNTWSAMKLADALKPSWTIPTTFSSSNGLSYTTSQIDTTYIRNSSLALLTSAAPTNIQTYDTKGLPDTYSGTVKIDTQYECPHMAHACMEPLNCTVYVNTTAKTCEIWAPTQSPSSCVETALTVLSSAGYSWNRSSIKVTTTFLGGGLGRKIEQDYISQAIRVAISAKVIGKPVKLTWTRVQDFKNDKYRPAAYMRVQASITPGSNSMTSLIYRNVASSISRQNNYSSTNVSTSINSNPPDTGALAGALSTTYTGKAFGLQYAVANRRIEFVPNNLGVPLGYWRSVGESYNLFAIESAIDELARASGMTDMIAFRKNLLTDVRSTGVLNAVAQLSNWSSAPPSGNARGVAFMASFGSYIALVAEVSELVNTTTGVKTVKVNKIYCAIDCGTPVNPDSIEGQIQGGIIHGLGATLWGQATFTAGKSNLSNFNTYRVVKLKDMPVISVKVMPSTEAVGGVGETAVPVVAPAIANAYAALNGTRIRKLPFYPGSTMGGL